MKSRDSQRVKKMKEIIEGELGRTYEGNRAQYISDFDISVVSLKVGVRLNQRKGVILV